MAIKQGPTSNKLTDSVKIAAKIKIGIVVAEWNKTITTALLDGCLRVLADHKIPTKSIIVKWVPGSFELPLAAKWLFDSSGVDAVICLGCVIKGETPHNHYISEAVSNGITQLSLAYSRPVIFGVLTPNNEQQALERAGGKKGNKGEDAAYAVLQMLKLKQELKSE
jgi:6,7-dimethyl-8-ribityllumazine synthase